MSVTSFWSAQADARALALWSRGFEAKAIAATIGTTPSAVIGRMWRLGAQRATGVGDANRSLAARLSHCHDGYIPPRGPTRLGRFPIPKQTPVPCSPRPWLEREDKECAYPVAGEGVDTWSCCNPECIDQADGSALLVENHCAICAAAAECQGFCRSELAIFQDMLGPEVEVARVEHALSGARRCAYDVRPRR